MASITQEKSGGWRFKYVDNGKCKGIRFGKCNKHDAQSAHIFLDRLIAAKRLASTPDGETIAWLNRLDDAIHARIAKAGLTPPRQDRKVPTLKNLIEQFTATLSGKPRTHAMYHQTAKNLITFLTDQPLMEITNQHADQYRVWLERDRKLAQATIARGIVAARTIFNKAIRWKMITENPFTGVKGGKQSNDARHHLVPLEEVSKLMNACPNSEWRAIIALSRFGGVRVPSEILPLKWSDIHWGDGKDDAGSIRITSPKTEHHHGGGTRLIPLFPEIYQPLLECFELAQPGEEFIITQRPCDSNTLHDHLKKIITRAGLKPWPRLFHNMRSSRISELLNKQRRDIAQIARWMGTSPETIAKHYLQSTNTGEDFKQAAARPEGGPESGPATAQKAALHTPAPESTEQQKTNETRMDQAFLPSDADGCRYVRDNPQLSRRISTWDPLRGKFGQNTSSFAIETFSAAFRHLIHAALTGLPSRLSVVFATTIPSQRHLLPAIQWTPVAASPPEDLPLPRWIRQPCCHDHCWCCL